MLSSFICGTFHPEEGEADEPTWNDFPRSPGKSRRHSLLRRSNNSSYIGKKSKNPYANRGLDKFSALVADLEEKRKEIYLQSGSGDIAFVRFITSSSDGFVPVVVKSKDRQHHHHHHHHHQNKEKKKKAERNEARKEIASATRDSETTVEPPEEVKAMDEPKVESNEEAKRKKSFSWRRPSRYVPLAMIVILLLLALFGRSFAIVCISIGWYVVPALGERGSTVVLKKKKKKMETSDKRVCENKNIARIGGASSPPRSNDGEENGGSRTQQHGHRKSW